MAWAGVLLFCINTYIKRICIYLSMHICVYVYRYNCIDVHMYRYVCMYIYIYIYICVCEFHCLLCINMLHRVVLLRVPLCRAMLYCIAVWRVVSRGFALVQENNLHIQRPYRIASYGIAVYCSIVQWCVVLLGVVVHCDVVCCVVVCCIGVRCIDAREGAPKTYCHHWKSQCIVFGCYSVLCCAVLCLRALHWCWGRVGATINSQKWRIVV